MSTIAAPQVQPNRVRWTVCAMLFLATSINYMDRQVLGILAPALQHQFGWTERGYSNIVNAFQVAYSCGLLLAGRLMDRIGTRAGYALIMGVWSLAAMGHTLATSAFGFGVARFFLGLGESGNFPAAVKTTAEWFPPRERSLATGIFNSGANLGAMLAPALLPVVALKLGWRAGFLTTGLFSAAWIVWWLLRYRPPAAAQAWETEAAAKLPWRSLLGFRQTWAYAGAKFLTDPIWYFYLFWLPKYLDSKFHLGLAHLGLPLILVYNLSAVGSIGGGSVPLFLVRRGLPVVRARFLAMLGMALAALPVFTLGRVGNEWAAVGLLGLAAAAHQGWSANLYTTASDMFPKEAVGAVTGIGGTAGSVGGVLFAAFIGGVLTRSGDYGVLFAIAGSAYLLAWAWLRAMAPGFRRISVPIHAA